MRYWFSILSLLLCVVTTNVMAQEQPLKVGVTPAKPFAMKDANGQWYGITIDLWKSVARESKYEYEFVEVPLITNIEKVRTGELDVGIGAISITPEREQIVDFSHSYFSSGLAIVTKKSGETSPLDMLTDPKLLKTVGGLLAFIFLGGILIILFENGSNGNCAFKKTDLDNGVWWSIVTITTTGYGDLVPKTHLGRLFAGVWMIVGAVVVPIMIGSLSATITNDKINSVLRSQADLGKHKIAVIAGTSTQRYFDANHMPYVLVENVSEMFDLIKLDKVQGGVYDAPMLQYYARNEPELVVLADTFNRENYGIMLSSGSELRENVNTQILIVTKDMLWSSIVNKYTGV